MQGYRQTQPSPAPQQAFPANPQVQNQQQYMMNPQNLLTSSIFLPQGVSAQQYQPQHLYQLQLLQQQQQLLLQQQQNRVIKIFIKPGSEIRKTIVSSQGLSLQTIKTKVLELVSKKPELANAPFSLFYKDEEGDWVRLENDEDWQCFVESAPASPLSSWKIKAKFAVKQPEPAPAVVAPQVQPQVKPQPAVVLPANEPKNFNFAPPLTVQQPLPVRQPIIESQQPVVQDQKIVIPAVVAMQSQPAPKPIVQEVIKPVEVVAPAPVIVAQTQPLVVQKPQPVPVNVEPVQQLQADSFVCDSCKQQITGARYECLQCEDYDLCLSCYPFRFTYHQDGHTFKLVDARPPVEPKPVVFEEPKPVPVVAQPVPVPQPKPVVFEEPKPVIVEQPKPVIVEQPKPVIVEQPKPVIVEQPKPVEEVFKYETEEKLLINMGLDDKEKVRKLLNQYQGSVNQVVDAYFAG